jgi:hypothetical protein
LYPTGVECSSREEKKRKEKKKKERKEKKRNGELHTAKAMNNSEMIQYLTVYLSSNLISDSLSVCVHNSFLLCFEKATQHKFSVNKNKYFYFFYN